MPIARSAGIQVPQATHRTSLFSVLIDPLREVEDCGALAFDKPFKTLDTFRKKAMYGRSRE